LKIKNEPVYVFSGEEKDTVAHFMSEKPEMGKEDIMPSKPLLEFDEPRKIKP
jgi:hypothetical protein